MSITTHSDNQETDSQESSESNHVTNPSASSTQTAPAMDKVVNLSPHRSYHPRTLAEIRYEFLANIQEPTDNKENLFSVLTSALATLTLPFFYLAFIVSGFALILWHATQNVHLLSLQPQALNIAFYITPIPVGLLILGFLSKPLFAKRISQIGIIPLSHKENKPLLFFTQELARVLGAPTPEDIRVSVEPEVKYSLVGGFNGLVNQRFHITIGLPLLKTFNNRQLAALIAHEMAYYSGPHPMRLVWLIRTIRAWFWRCGYQLDAWDYKVIRATKGTSKIVALLAKEALSLINVTKLIYRQFFKLCEIFSDRALTPLQKRADYFAATTSGMDAFKKAESVRHVLYLAYEHYLCDFDPQNQSDDLCQFLVNELSRYHKNKDKYPQQKLAGRLPTATNSWASREKSMQSFQFPNDLVRSYMVQSLLPSIDSIAKSASAQLHKDFFGIEIETDQQHPQTNNYHEDELKTFYSGNYQPTRIIPVNAHRFGNFSKQELTKQLNHTILSLRTRLPDWHKQLASSLQSRDNWMNAIILQGEYYAEHEKREETQKAEEELLGKLHELAEFESLVQKRICLGFALAGQQDDDQLLEETNDISHTSVQLYKLTGSIMQLEKESLLLQSMLRAKVSESDRAIWQTLQQDIKRYTNQVAHTVNHIHGALTESNSRYLIPMSNAFKRARAIDRRDPSSYLSLARITLQSLTELNHALQQNTTSICLKIEAQAKVAPLKIQTDFHLS